MPIKHLPSRLLAIALRDAIDHLEAGHLIAVEHKITDDDLYKISFKLAAPSSMQNEHTPPDLLPCPRCGVVGKVSNGGKTPGVDPPTLDLLCLACDHSWQVPLAPEE